MASVVRAEADQEVVGNLPLELTSFVGRRRELAEARRLFESSRLLTLTGIGGVGKTRLAIRPRVRSSGCSGRRGWWSWATRRIQNFSRIMSP